MREKEFDKLVDEVAERISLRILGADWVCYRCGESSVLERIEKLEQEAAKRVPIVDAVEVVRCKDCKHRPAFRYDDDGDRYVEGPRYQETLKNGLTVTFQDETCPCVNGWDFFYSHIPKDDWFCANGERRAEE